MTFGHKIQLDRGPQIAHGLSDKRTHENTLIHYWIHKITLFFFFMDILCLQAPADVHANITVWSSFDFIINVPLLRFLRHYSSFRDRISVLNSILLSVFSSLCCKKVHLSNFLTHICLLIWIIVISCSYVTSYTIHKGQIITKIIIILIRNTYLAPAHTQEQHIWLSSVSVIFCGPIHKWDCYFLRWCNTSMANFLLLCHSISILFNTCCSYFPFR